jgi:hypothetical protein
MFRSIACALAGICFAGQAFAQQVNRLDCQGSLSGTPAAISGTREFTQTTAVGDGYVRFQGGVAAGGMEGSVTYEGYTATAPFSGVMEGPLGRIAIGVLDNTGGRMIIYSGTPSLGPPNELGEFVCNWQ